MDRMVAVFQLETAAAITMDIIDGKLALAVKSYFFYVK